MLSPGFLYNSIGGASEMQVQAVVGYQINPEKDLRLKLGPGYRIGDAMQVLLGAETGNLKVMASYDITLSGLSELNV